MAFEFFDAKTESSIDFSKLNDTQLAVAYAQINPTRYPANLSVCAEEIQARKDRGQWREPPTPEGIGRGLLAAFVEVLRAPRTKMAFALLTFAGFVLFSPIMFLGTLFGLAGSDGRYFVLIGLAYVGAILFSIATLFDRKYFRWLLGCYAAGVLGLAMDAQFWSYVNRGLCSQLRSDPSCLETADGFICQNSAKYGNFITPKSVCR